ncbi:kelch domain-containing protein 3-like [Amblyomma americanum]
MWTVRLNRILEGVCETAVTIQGKVYSFDSFDICYPDSDEISGYLIDVCTFNPTSYRWNLIHTQSFLEEVPVNIMGRGVVAYGHCAYLSGGESLSPVGFYRFDTVSMTWSRPGVCGQVPRADIHHSACVVGQRMYIFGGFHRDSSEFVHFLDLETLEWHRVPTSGVAPDGRCWHTTTTIGTRMYVWGGNLDGSQPNVRYDNSLYYLETTTATWVRPQVQGVAPEGRECHAAFVYDRELYIYGGYNELLNTHYTDMHKYDVEKSRWTKVTPTGSGPSARHSASCSVLGERVLVFGGFGPPPILEEEEYLEDIYEEEVELTDLHVLHLAPTLQNLCMLAVIDADLDTGKLPEFIIKKINTFRSGQS